MTVKLSKKNQKSANVFPYFFLPTIVFAEELKKSVKLSAPKLSTNRDEGIVEYNIRNGGQLVIQYVWPNFIELKFYKKDELPSRKTTYKTFDEINKENVTELHTSLMDYYSSMQIVITEEIEKTIV